MGGVTRFCFGSRLAETTTLEVGLMHAVDEFADRGMGQFAATFGNGEQQVAAGNEG